MRVGFVISGGFARGAAQYGFMKAILEHIPEEDICMISSASIGAINTIGIANHKRDVLEYYYNNLNIMSLRKLRHTLKNREADRIFNDLIGTENTLNYPIYIVGTLMNDLTTHYFCIDNNTPLQNMRKYAEIAVTFPLIKGIVYNDRGKLWIDGGASDNIPVYPFFYHDVDLLIIIHCTPRYLPPIDYFQTHPDTVVLDIDVTADQNDHIFTYLFTVDNLQRMLNASYEEGKIFAERVLCDYNLDMIRERGKEYMNEKMDIRNHVRNNLRAGIFFNKIQRSRHLGSF